MKSNIRIADSTGGKLLMAGLFLLLMFALTIPVQASPPGWADRGNKGEPPGWSQVNPGAGGSDGPAQGPNSDSANQLDSSRSWPDSARPPGWSHQNPGQGGSDGPAEGPQGSR